MRLLLCGIILVAAPVVSYAQQRMIITTEAGCRERPDTSAPVVYTYRLGQPFGIRTPSQDPDTTWLFDDWHVTRTKPNCWVESSVTTPFRRDHPEPALIVLADRMLKRADKVRFEEYVTAENLLVGPYAASLGSSGPLQYRRLLLVSKAADAMHAQYGVTENTLATAWALGHSDMLRHSPFSSNWYPLTAPYWSLYEVQRHEPWADDLAWTAAQLRPPLDECYSDCVLENLVVDGPLQYWIRIPEGKNIVSALELATERARYTVGVACLDPARPIPREFQLIDRIRGSLTKVRAEEKNALLAQLAQIEAACKKK